MTALQSISPSLPNKKPSDDEGSSSSHGNRETLLYKAAKALEIYHKEPLIQELFFKRQSKN